MNSGQELYKKALGLIPGGTQLFSKRPERLLPNHWPVYYTKAKGVSLWDLDGKEYIDMTTSGIGTCILGYADSDVEAEVIKAIQNGSMSSFNCSEEVELAELLCDLHPWAEMARFTRGGGEALAVAIRIARASTGRDMIAFCGYHGWQDWYLAANLNSDASLDAHLLPGLSPQGVPRELTGTIIPFNYNKIEELEKIISDYGERIAAIVMEPARSTGPDPGFLEKIRSIAEKNHSVLIFDEVTSGWRAITGGIHLTYGVNPDIAVFAKAMGNGYPMSAIIGKKSVMQAAQNSFISSTYWTERIGPVAALATIKKHRKLDLGPYLMSIGELMQQGWKNAAEKTGMKISVSGVFSLSSMSIKMENSDALETLFIKLMIERGYVAHFSFYPCASHNPENIQKYFQVLEEVFAICKKASDEGNVEKVLDGPVRHKDFRRLN